jgi:IS30 family transposase
MKRYTRLTLAEREEISRHVAVGVSVRAMARQLGRALSTISRRAITHVQTLLNGRPRKVLNWRTPSEVFHNVPVALET